LIVPDFSPPTKPTLDQQREALQKGLGRTMLWARTGRFDDDASLDACLHDRRFDRQIDESRSGWLSPNFGGSTSSTYATTKPAAAMHDPGVRANDPSLLTDTVRE